MICRVVAVSADPRLLHAMDLALLVVAVLPVCAVSHELEPSNRANNNGNNNNGNSSVSKLLSNKEAANNQGDK